MARQYLKVEGVADMLAMTKNQVYKLVRRPIDPLPHRKIGKQLRFDEERIHQWFLCQPGSDGEHFEL
jgi:predicted DNA-binding transcriptional regulator AlpA